MTSSRPGVSGDGVRCVRPGCSHGYGIHAPGGGGCLYWFPLSGEHCPCHGFRWVELPTDLPSGPPRYSR